jgi:hypothetical protein
VNIAKRLARVNLFNGRIAIKQCGILRNTIDPYARETFFNDMAYHGGHDGITWCLESIYYRQANSAE